ncbi:hypothetical protein J2752_002637 [Halarchaeum rubridurum]|uniref:Histidine kinase-, DNA gyrase B-, and HSP90-like ATPase n=1 Tax=Halarchaeum rubridurum TaxID=489911 RepID=A0A830G3D7_9EURY|nr:hypothetical protein [Halarchaeum rubridurum]MBP1955708.1 hypothetical protein [Halarchaeum rubridurum]GGM74002.1 hypothetical protein GCM10009017_24960 [Halarchaeum rubridurum]
MSERVCHAGTELKTFADRFLTANDPSEVHRVLADLDDAHRVTWVPLGNDENNYSDVYTQASSPMAAFTELPLNAEDALMFRFYDAADGVEPDAYSSMKDAVAADWVNLDDAELEIIADGTKPTDGNLLNLTVRDNGKGKTRENFSDFVDLHAPGLKKQEYGFLQGQYGMGSTAVMQFCGDIEDEYNENAFKFIASASPDAPGEWSWTLVHDKPRKGRVEYLTIDGAFPSFDGTFGGALTEKFRANYPDKYDFAANTTTPDPQTHGSFIKVYDYQTNAARSLISGDEGFRRKFQRSVVDSPYPIRLTDMRYNTKLPQSTTQGFLPDLRHGYDHLLKGEDHLTVDTGSETLGERDITVLLFHSDDALEDIDTTSRGKSKFVAGTTGHKDSAGRTGIQRDHAVMFTINGQTHASKGEYFLKSLGYSKVASDTVVIIEFDDLANLGMVNLFGASRDTLKDSPQANKLITALKDALDRSDLLSAEEDRRRASRGNAERATDTETFADFIERNPEIGNYMATGERVDAPQIRPSDRGDDTPAVPGASSLRDHTDPGHDDGDDTDESSGPPAPKLPTYLTPISGYHPGTGDHDLWDPADGVMAVDMPANSRTTVRFATDAQSDYLTRDILRGSLTVSPSAQLHAVELQDGLLTLTLTPGTGASPGDDFALTVELTRPDPRECTALSDPADAYPGEDAGAVTDGGSMVDTSPLTAMCRIDYTEPEPSTSETPSTDSEADDSEGSGESGSGDRNGESGDDGQTDDWGFEMPDIARVYEENWRTDDDENPIVPDEFDREAAAHFDEHTLIQLEPSRDGSISGLSLTINMDAAPLQSFIVNRNVRDNWKPSVERQYELAMVFYTITMYRDYVAEYGTSLEGTDLITADVVARSINALAPTIMPTIIPDDQLDRITE